MQINLQIIPTELLQPYCQLVDNAQHQAYYNNIRALGLEYPELDYSRALPFLRMLPESLTGLL